MDRTGLAYTEIVGVLGKILFLLADRSFSHGGDRGAQPRRVSEDALLCEKSSRDFPVTSFEPTQYNASLWRSTGIDFSGELRNNRFRIGWLSPLRIECSRSDFHPRIGEMLQNISKGGAERDKRVGAPETIFTCPRYAIILRV
jgi:hypothetical protein